MMKRLSWRLLTSITLLLLGTSSATNAAFVYSGGTSKPLSTVVGNDYVNSGELGALGFDTAVTGARVSVDQSGFIDFYFIAAESGYSNTFTVTDQTTSTTYSLTEPANNKTTIEFNGQAGYSIITIAVTAGEIIKFKFTNGLTGSSGNTVDNFTSTIRLQDLGLFLNSTSQPLNQLILAYDDQWINPVDDNHDDMMIRADFRPVPVPAAFWLMGSGLLGLAGFTRRKFS